MAAFNRYKLAHATLFSYDASVTESYNELRLRPRHDESQSCLSFRITTYPFSKPVAHLDYFNNWVHHFHILPEHSELRVESEATVLVHPQPWYAGAPLLLTELDQRREDLKTSISTGWRRASIAPFCRPLPRWRARWRRVSDGTVRGFSEAASSLIHERFTYKPGATHVHSSVEDSW